MASSKNRTQSRPKTIRHGFHSIYYLSRCIGQWPFTITYNSNGSIKGSRVHLFDGFWFLLSICLYSAVLFFAYKSLKKWQDQNETYFLSFLIFTINQIPPLLLGVVAIALDMYNRNRLVNILKNFTTFDKEV